tara:strand:- start:199 stop:891 length:693 start_codon:yes stop_codon:yes gene_type:complete
MADLRGRDKKKDSSETKAPLNYDEKTGKLKIGEDDTLHRAVWKGIGMNDTQHVEKLLENEDVRARVNALDARGHAALHIAAHLGHPEMVSVLLRYGAQATVKSYAGWMPLHEAIATGSFQTTRRVFLAAQERMNKELLRRCEILVEALPTMEDFYLELDWSFKSWVPIVSRYLPSDKYCIWKKGSWVRVDSTLAGFEGTSFIRGHITFLFTGKECARPGELLVINQDKKV